MVFCFLRYLFRLDFMVGITLYLIFVACVAFKFFHSVRRFQVASLALVIFKLIFLECVAFQLPFSGMCHFHSSLMVSFAFCSPFSFHSVCCLQVTFMACCLQVSALLALVALRLVLYCPHFFIFLVCVAFRFPQPYTPLSWWQTTRAESQLLTWNQASWASISMQIWRPKENRCNVFYILVVCSLCLADCFNKNIIIPEKCFRLAGIEFSNIFLNHTPKCHQAAAFPIAPRKVAVMKMDKKVLFISFLTRRSCGKTGFML